MGRIQRKKASRKKKKQSENLSAVSQVKDDAVENKAALSSVSTREILEIGSLCKSNFDATDLPSQKVKIFQRDDTIEDLMFLKNHLALLNLSGEPVPVNTYRCLKEINFEGQEPK